MNQSMWRELFMRSKRTLGGTISISCHNSRRQGANTAHQESALSILPGGFCTCPGSDGCALVHFHTRSVRKAFGLIPTWQSAVHTGEGMVRADVEKQIDLFFHGQDDSILQTLGAA